MDMTSERRRPDAAFWQRTRVLLTGHTGFKGSWLARMLARLGAEVHGLALDPTTTPAMFEVARIPEVLHSDNRIDIRNGTATAEAVRIIAPHIVLHLAAQPLVREGYRDPAGTFATNVAGTANVLAAFHRTLPAPQPQAIVIVTSDKVYRQVPEPDGEVMAHGETAALGGTDPYSSSKAMVEELVEVFRRLPAIDSTSAWDLPVATARAGNVIGGGDWSHDRLIPDCIDAFTEGRPVVLRYPAAVRPWQHVLEPLAGYLLLAEDLATRSSSTPSAVNFGPADADGTGVTVREIARAVARRWGVDQRLVVENPSTEAPETGELRVDSTLAMASLNWQPRWSTTDALARTVDWYQAQRDGQDMAVVTDQQIDEYFHAR